MKCSAIKIDGKLIDVHKDPVHKDPVGDETKRSKRGILNLYFDGKEYFTTSGPARAGWEKILLPVYENGKILREWTLEEIQARANL